jgi:hypothetical protein
MLKDSPKEGIAGLLGKKRAKKAEDKKEVKVSKVPVVPVKKEVAPPPPTPPVPDIIEPIIRDKKEESPIKEGIKEKLSPKKDNRYTVPGDKLPDPPEQTQSSGDKKDNTGEAFKQAASLMMMFVKEGGRLNSKAKKRKSKRVVRGVGVAKRGYGKATYSKKMY